MIAIAIGPQNTLRDRGIIASTVAAAVSSTGAPGVFDGPQLILSGLARRQRIDAVVDLVARLQRPLARLLQRDVAIAAQPDVSGRRSPTTTRKIQLRAPVGLMCNCGPATPLTSCCRSEPVNASMPSISARR